MQGTIIKGSKTTFKKDTRGLGQFFFESAAKHGNKICQIDAATGEEESFRSVKERSTRAAVHMRQMGINSEDVILFCSKNNLNSIIPVLASLYLGAKVASIDPTLSARDCTHCINLVSPKFIFVEEDSVKLVEKSLLEVKFKVDIIEYTKFSNIQEPCPEEKDFRPVVVKDCHDTGFIYFSSGTTGLPKGICITHFGLINADISLLNMGHVIFDVTINFTSLYWISAAILLTMSFITGGCRVLPAKFEAEKVLNLIQTYKVTCTMIAPIYTYNLINVENFEKYDTSSLHTMVVVGTPISPEQLLRTRQFFKNTFVINGYGCTEAAGFITCFNVNKDKHMLNKLRSSGKCVDDLEIKVVDVETKELLGPNQKGELCIRSPYAMKGYYNQDTSAVYDDDGFIKTGDICYYDEDECFYIIDRIKEMFKYKSWHVVPTYIEAVLQEHPAVKEAVVFGIPHEIDEFHPTACVLLKENETASAAEIEMFVSEKVSEWHKLRGGVKIVNYIPKTPSGKVQRTKMREIFLG